MEPWEPGYARWRREKAFKNLLFIALLFIGFITVFILFITKDVTKTINVNNVKTEDRRNVKMLEPLETCVDGKKVVIINGVTYYAGTIDTWGDIESIECQ